MSKLSFLPLAAVIGLAAASCSKNVQNTEPAMAPVCVRVSDFAISMDPMLDTKVQDIAYQYAPVQAATLAFYDASGTEVYHATQIKADATEENPFGVFACQLPVGTHTMVVVGYGLLTDDTFVLNSPTSAAFTSAAGVRDTFSKVQSVTVSGSGPNNFSATLDRVTAKLQLSSTDGKLAETNSIRITFGKGGKAFNPTTGLATTNTGFSRLVSAGTVNGHTTVSLSFLYLAEDEQTMDLTIEPVDDDGNAVACHILSDVPFKRNCSTNVSGPVFSANTLASGFSINEGWGTPYVVEY